MLLERRLEHGVMQWKKRHYSLPAKSKVASYQ
jgi:hypothetical protein